MKRYELDRVTEAKYGQHVERIVAMLKSQPGDVWSQFSAGIQGGDSALFAEADRLVKETCLEAVRACSNPELGVLWRGSDALWKSDGEDPGIRAAWEEGVHRELYERVRYAAGEAGLDGDKQERKKDEFQANFRFEADDLVFLQKVARRVASLTAKPGLAPEKAAAIRRAVAALKKLPELTPDIGIRIEVGHRMGGEEFSERYSYTVELDRQRIEIGASGSQHDPAVGTTSFTLESLKWSADGQAVHEGNRDIWLERLAYALTRDYTVTATSGESGENRAQPT